MSNLLPRMITRSMASARACKVPSSKSKQDSQIPVEINKEKLEVVDLPDKNMFVMKLGQHEANVEYTLNGNTYDLVFSNVPDHMQGKGLGKILAQNTRNYCTCEYPAMIVELDLCEDKNLNQFIMKLNGSDATIDFELKDGTYKLGNTLVPVEYRNRGLGKIIAQKTFDLIVEKDKKMKLTCEFLEHFYKQNEKRYSKHVVA